MDPFKLYFSGTDLVHSPNYYRKLLGLPTQETTPIYHRLVRERALANYKQKGK